MRYLCDRDRHEPWFYLFPCSQFGYFVFLLVSLVVVTMGDLAVRISSLIQQIDRPWFAGDGDLLIAELDAYLAQYYPSPSGQQ